MEKLNYWLFIIPEDRWKGLWGRCLKEEVLAMEYILGDSDYPKARYNLDKINQIKERDIVVAYLNKTRIGGIGRVVKRHFDAKKPYEGCGDDGFRQRIGVEWIYKRDRNYPIIDYKKVLGNKKIYTATIHQISKEEFKKIKYFTELKDEDEFIDEIVSLDERDEIIDGIKERDIEQKINNILPKDSVKKEKKIQSLLKKYKEKAPPPQKITEKKAKKIERGPIGKLIKEKYNSICQVASCRFTFKKKDGMNYAEAHHLEHLAEGGLDIEKNIVILCSNCHARFHYANVEKISRDKYTLKVKINGALKVIKFK